MGELKFSAQIQHTQTNKNPSDNFTNSQVRSLNHNMGLEATVPKVGRAIPSPAVVAPLQPKRVGMFRAVKQSLGHKYPKLQVLEQLGRGNLLILSQTSLLML